MTANYLFDGLKINENGNDLNVEISGIVSDSRLVKSGDVFFAVKGERFDGNDYIEQAISRGAKFVVTENADCKAKNAIIASDIHEVMSVVSERFYNINGRIKLIGVVGTNGKTSTTILLKNALTAGGLNVGVIGTLGVKYDGVFIEPELTTPCAITLSKILSDMIARGVQVCCMELSAHAIAQKRAYALKFEQLIFTNCTHDHLDYFKDFSTYKNVKKSAFIENSCKNYIINADDNTGVELLNELKNPVSYGILNPSDVFAIDITTARGATSYIVNAFDKIKSVKQKLIGMFNVYNALAAITSAVTFGVSLESAVKGITETEAVPGRIEFVEEFNGADVYVDYAHTPDGLKNALNAVRRVTSGRLILLFGCGGNRDKEKRKIMGEIAASLADYTIVTSDNPRFEEPFSIIREIERGIRPKTMRYITIQNRYRATEYALSYLRAGDVLLLSGKGAENYQEIMGVKIKYNDKEAVKELIAKLDFGGELI